jgi:hypothetical protein
LGFDLEKFRSTDFERRTARVSVPALSMFFGPDEKAEFTVQCLSGPEAFTAENRVAANSVKEKAIALLSSAKVSDKSKGLLKLYGLDGETTPDQLVKMIAYVELGVCSVKLDQHDVVRMAEYSLPSVLALFSEINSLTNLGFVPLGESNATGKTQESATG